MNYDFSTLSSKEFEILSCDLLNAKFNEMNKYGQFRNFKEGKDKGIDLLYSTQDNNYKVVVQIKHYIKSSFSKLKSDLLKNEKVKVEQLNPESYFFITSQELSVENKESIKEIFNPYILSIDDIYGQEDLNALIRKYPVVEEKHFKLWFSSITVLQKILNYKFQGRNNEFDEENFKKKIRLFVLTKDFFKAKIVLEKNKFIIITGDPGVGKTFNSEMLIYNYIKDDYELTIIYDDIKDIELKIREDDSKQIFYFDDFLGHTQAEIVKSKSAESYLYKILNRIEKSKNKYLILNTRKFILNSFIEDSERFKSYNPLRAESKIEFLEYSNSIKRRILFNHINESDLEERQIELIKNLSFDIYMHKNFTPRLIEFFTSKFHVGQFSVSELKLFILENLENPKKIWEHAYKNQISDYDRFLLNTLYSLGSSVTLPELEKAYNYRLDYEVKNNNFKKPFNSFNDCLKNLNEGFININQFFFDEYIFIGFINPSLEDFLNYLILENNLEISRILKSSKNIEQWYFFFKPYIDKKNKIDNELKLFYSSNIEKIIESNNVNDIKLQSVIFLNYFNNDDKKCISLLSGIDNWSFLVNNDKIHTYLSRFVKCVISNNLINDCIAELKWEFKYYLINNTVCLDEMLELAKILDKHYGFNFSKYYIQNIDNNSLKELQKQLNYLAKDFFINDVNESYELLLKTKDEILHEEIIYLINEKFDLIRELIYVDFDANYIHLNERDWKSVAFINNIENVSEEYNDDYFDEDFYPEDLEDETYNYDEYLIPQIYYFDESTHDLPF